MSIGDLEQRSGQLRDEIRQLEADLEAQVVKQEDMLGGIRARLQEVSDAAAKKKSVSADNRNSTKVAQAEIQAAIDADEAEAQRLAKEASEERLELLKITHDLSANLAAAASRCTTCEELVLVEHRLHLSEYGPVLGGSRLGLLSRSRVEDQMDPHVQLEREVESLEERRAALKEEISKGVLDLSSAQRVLMDQMDDVKRKMGQQDASDNQAAARLADRAKRLERQQGAVARFKAAQQDNADRAKKDLADVKAKLDELLAAMKSCGCAP